MSTTKMLHNANKIMFLVLEYPEKNLQQVLDLFKALPNLEVNTALWYAEEAGWVKINKEDQRIEVTSPPEKWAFGPKVEELKELLIYGFQQLAKGETDMEETEIGFWCAGYPPHDLLVAMKSLLQEKQLVEYDLADPDDLKSVYTFYSLYENGEQLWGRKQFKKDPIVNPKKEKEDGPAK